MRDKRLALNGCTGSSSDFQPEESYCELTPSIDCETSSPYPSQQAKPAKKARSPQPADPGPAPELTVKSVWLRVGHGEKDFLLLVDVRTGDILIPLSQVKRVISGNFSRKLASYTARLVVEPESGLGGRTPEQAWYWRKAFESPKNVKIEVKKALGEDASTAGHISIVLLPIVYNAIVTKEKEFNEESKDRQDKCKDFPWKSRFFVEVERLLMESGYSGLIKKREPCTPSAPTKSSMHTRSNSRTTSRVEASAETGEVRRPLLRGPTSLEETQAKYMFTFKNERARQNSRGPGVRTKRGLACDAGQPLLPVIPAASRGLEEQLASIQEELQESKRHCRMQDAKIDSLEKKLSVFDGFMAKLCQKARAQPFTALEEFGGKQLSLQHRTKSTETISSSGAQVEDHTPTPPSQVCWDDSFPSIGVERHSAPPEFNHGMGSAETPSPSYQRSTPLHAQHSVLEHSGSDLTPLAGHANPFRSPHLPTVATAAHFLTPMEDTTNTPFAPMDYGRAPRAPSGGGALALHRIPPQYGELQMPFVGHMGARNDSGLFNTFNLGPDALNPR